MALRECGLAFRRVSFSFGGARFIEDLSFEIPAGEVVALIGPNGAGKTTVVDLACGYLRPSQGGIQLLDADIAFLASNRVARLGVGRSFQHPRVFQQMSVRDNVMTGMRNDLQDGWLSALRRGNRFRRAERSGLEHALRLLSDCGIEGSADKQACELSFGQRRLLELCRLRAFAPRLYLLDEPFSGLFTETMEVVKRVILDLAASGSTVVFVEHNMEAVRSIADRVIVLDSGRIIGDGKPMTVLDQPEVLEAYLGVDRDVDG